jgi:hypothetical protein
MMMTAKKTRQTEVESDQLLEEYSVPYSKQKNKFEKATSGTLDFLPQICMVAALFSET